MGYLTVVGPVRSIDDIAGLRRVGASGTSFLLAPHPFFRDDPIISLADARRVCQQFPGRHGLLLSPTMTREQVGRLLASLPVSFVDLDVRVPPSPEVIALARGGGLEIWASGIELEHDTAIEFLTWFLDRATTRFQPDLLVLDLVPSWRDPYEWFTKEAGAHPDDPTQGQVNEVLRTYPRPVLVNMDLGDRAPQVLQELFPAARGSYTRRR